MFHDLCQHMKYVCHWPLTLHDSSRLRRLEHSHYLFSYKLACWCRCEVSTTCYFPSACVTPVSEDPRRLSKRSFHNYMLHFYIHRSYQWTPCHHGEQACINGLTERLCNLRRIGCITALILLLVDRSRLTGNYTSPKFLNS
jgi:hypothetical protein